MTLNKHKQIEFKKAEEREAKKANSPVDLSGLAGAINEAITKARRYLAKQFYRGPGSYARGICWRCN